MQLIVPVVKAKQTLTFDTDSIPETVYAEALRLGLKELLNRGMVKLTKAAFKDDEAALAAGVMEVANKNYTNILEGKIRIAGAKSDKASGKVMVEARRLAKAAVKEELKRQNIKVSYVSAKDLTEAANALIASDPTFVEKAKVNVAETESTKNEALSNIVKSVKVDDTLKARDEEKKAAAKAALSATQAKIPQKRAQA
jgi:hypothetical protein